MKAVVKAIKGLVQAVEILIDFVVDLFEDLIYMIELLGEFIVNIPTYLSWLPAPVIAIIVTIFSIVVIYKIIGREG